MKSRTLYIAKITAYRSGICLAIGVFIVATAEAFNGIYCAIASERQD